MRRRYSGTLVVRVLPLKPERAVTLATAADVSYGTARFLGGPFSREDQVILSDPDGDNPCHVIWEYAPADLTSAPSPSETGTADVDGGRVEPKIAEDRNVESVTAENATGPLTLPREWENDLSRHAPLVALEFSGVNDMERAIDALGLGPIEGMPFDIPDANVLVVPASAAGHFQSLGLQFSSRPLAAK